MPSWSSGHVVGATALIRCRAPFIFLKKALYSDRIVLIPPSEVRVRALVMKLQKQASKW